MTAPGGTKVIIIKKKAKAHAHHGGAWKVAYADFVTAMMALFIVLWLLTQSDQASRERIAQYFRTGVLPGGTMMQGKPAGSSPPVAVDIFPAGASGSPEQEQRALQQLATAISEALDDAGVDSELARASAHVRVRVVDEGALIELLDGGDRLLFDSASAQLKPAATALLQALAPLLAGLRNAIELHGHTDARPFDPAAGTNNWDLSYARAAQARKVMEQHGLPAGKITAVLAHAESELYNPADPYAPENRRLGILVVRRGRERARSGHFGRVEAAPPR